MNENEKMELRDEQLEQVSGGASTFTMPVRIIRSIGSTPALRVVFLP